MSQIAETRAPIGLTLSQVNERIARGQTNSAPPKSARTNWDIVRDNVFTLFNVVLFAALAALLIASRFFPNTRNLVVGDAVFTGGTVFFNTLIGIVQEARAKHTLDQLAALSIRLAKVRRDGRSVEIPVSQIVLDEVIEIAPGDRVPVDGPVIESRALHMDESLLTGESDGMTKSAGDALLSGTFCVAGSGLMRAEKIGAQSYANQLTQTARADKRVLTPLQQKINVVIKFLVAIMIVVAGLQLAQLLVAPNPGARVVEVLRYVLVIIASFVPAGLLLAITLSLSFGAVRISRYDTLVQRLNAVESMGNVTVLCVDKTGTLTRNVLSVQAVLALNGHTEAQARNALARYVNHVASRNKTATAIATFVQGYANNTNESWRIVAEIPFSSTLKWGAVRLSATTDDGRTTTVALGSPEALIDPSRTDILTQAATYTQQGLRVVALTATHNLPGDPSPISHLQSLAPIALVVIRDEIRDDIVETIDQFRAQGVRIAVISGDNAETVQAIAGRVGIPNGRVITEPALAQLDAAGFDAAVKSHQLFARIVPNTKKRIVESLTRQGEYVAMVGDGVNDVPALKQARLGIAMNDGAQIAKDVSDLVLLQNTMSTLPKALKEGQEIAQKIFASAKLYLVKNVLTILGLLFAGFVGLGFPTSPRLISWATFITINIPCVLLAFNLIRPNYSKKFLRDVVGYGLLFGGVGAIMVAVAFVGSYALTRDLAIARTVFGLANLHYGLHVFLDAHNASVWSLRSLRRSPRLAVLALVLLVIGWGMPLALPRLFGAVAPSQLSLVDWLIIAVLPLLSVLAIRRIMLGRIISRMAHTLAQ